MSVDEGDGLPAGALPPFLLTSEYAHLPCHCAWSPAWMLLFLSDPPGDHNAPPPKMSTSQTLQLVTL